MKELYQILGVKLAATMVYHPQGDRQTENINQELEQFLWLFTNQWQDNWGDLLPVAEFQYNNHIHFATQNIPFLLDTSHGIWTGPATITCGVCQPVQREDEDTLKEAKAALAKSKDDIVKYYNQRRTPAPDYKPRDKVYLDTSNIQTTRPLQKLSHWWLGPLCHCQKSQKQCILTSSSPLHEYPSSMSSSWHQHRMTQY